MNVHTYYRVYIQIKSLSAAIYVLYFDRNQKEKRLINL